MVSSKPYPRNLLMAFKIFNSHFDVQNCRFRALFCLFTGNQAEIQKNTTDSMLTTPWACYFPKITFLAFPQIKLFIKTSKNHPVSAHSTRLLTPEAKIKKNRTDSLKFRQFSGFSPNLKTWSLFLWKNLKDSCLTAVNQMVGGSGTNCLMKSRDQR